MFNSPIVDLVIVLSFTYFVLSLMVSTLHEFIFSLLTNKRGKFLDQAIQNLFFDPDWKKFVQQKLYKSPHIEVLKSKEDQFPSYIPASNFAMALMDQLKGADAAPLDMNQVRSFLSDDTRWKESLLSPGIRNTLLSLYDRASGNLDQLQKNIETYFNNAMDRASGVYKRSAQKFIALIAFILAASLNADSLYITKTLWENPDALKQTVDNISVLAKQVQKDSTGKFSITADAKKVILQTKVKEDSIGTDSSGNLLKVPVEAIKETRIYLNKAGIPIGWTNLNIPTNCFWDWLLKLAGILLTTLALMLGAPFWFDLLNKLINLRMSGKKPDGDGGK